jgi:hypothetical protein
MADDNVTPFRRHPPPSPDRRLHPSARRGQPGARDLAAAQNVGAREAYDAAVTAQRAERLLAAGRPVPARITIALDVCGLHGPDVDERCGTWEGNPDGDVDRWELGLAVPSGEQVRLLAELTGFPIASFYKPIQPGPILGDGPTWVCWGGRRGCEAVAPNVVDERGVLLYGGEPRTLPDAVQGQLFGGVPAEPKRPSRTAPARKAPKKAAPAAVQPTLPNRMPAELRAALDAKLAARRKHP